MDQRECSRCQELSLFSFSSRLSNEGGRIPLRKKNLVAVQFQPSFQQVHLSGFSGTIKPFNGQPASAGNGAMVALEADSNEKVDAVYKKAMALGAKDEGPAGARSPQFYAAFFRDPEGNKLAVYHSS